MTKTNHFLYHTNLKENKTGIEITSKKPGTAVKG